MMKLISRAKAAALVLLASGTFLHAAINVLDPNYGVQSYYTHSTTDSIVSYDWASDGGLYYMTSTSSYSFGGFYRAGATPTTIAGANAGLFPGASVVALGGYVYYNTSDFSNTQIINSYGPVGGSPVTAVASTAVNWGLYVHDGQIFITGAEGWGTNHIYAATPGSGGALPPPLDLGQTSGSSGPLAFDVLGNLFYAPGYGDLTIYRWTAAEVAAALAGTQLTIQAENIWLQYDELYAAYPGGTSMLIDGDKLYLTLTSFSDPSVLAAFGIDEFGAYAGDYITVLEDTNRLGDLRSYNGGLYLSSGNQIVQIVPEPSAFGLLLFGAVAVLLVRRRTAAVAVLGIASGGIALAGPYAPGSDQPGGAGIPSNSPLFVGWATGVAEIQRGPVDITNPGGALASYGDPSAALGPATGYTGDPGVVNPYEVVSLGDGGWITLTFDLPITNGAGADFAVFENTFQLSGSTTQYFAELAFVLVSSDGVNFFKFPAVSLTQTTTQVGGFGTLDPSNIHNLAGKDLSGFGTPFDLEDLADVSPLLNINAITHVRIQDVVGSIDPAYASYDSLGNIINDPFKTNFATGGFDLDAIGVIHAVPEPAIGTLALFGWLVLTRRRTRRRQA